MFNRLNILSYIFHTPQVNGHHQKQVQDTQALRQEVNSVLVNEQGGKKKFKCLRKYENE